MPRWLFFRTAISCRHLSRFFPKCVILGAAVSSSSLFEIKFRMLRRSVRPFDGSWAVAFASRGKTQEQPSCSFGVPPRSEKIANDRFAEKESFRKFAALTPLHRSSIFWQSGGKKKDDSPAPGRALPAWGHRHLLTTCWRLPHRLTSPSL